MKNDDKLVSIIVPSYNGEKYIGECLASLINQSYKDIEVIVVDDGSTDKTFEVASEYASNDRRINVYRKKNEGVSSARNYALELIKGKYCVFVDSDDFIADTAVEKMVNAIETDGTDWVNCQYHKVDGSGNVVGNSHFLTGVKNISDSHNKFVFLRDCITEHRIGYEVCLKLFKTELIMKHGIRFDQSCFMGEDLKFCMSYSLLANNISCIEDCLYFYRFRNESAMNSVTSLKALFEQRLHIVKDFQLLFCESFPVEYQRKYYQIFYKLMVLALIKFTPKEISVMAGKATEYKYYNAMLSEAIAHKKDFYDFYTKSTAMFFWNIGYYIWTQLNHSIRGKIYFFGYNFLRKLAGKCAIDQWREG